MSFEKSFIIGIPKIWNLKTKYKQYNGNELLNKITNSTKLEFLIDMKSYHSVVRTPIF